MILLKKSCVTSTWIYGRLELGLQISCPGSKHHNENAIKRRVCKEKLTNGTYTPLEYLIDVSSTVGKQSYHATKGNDFGDEFLYEISDEDEAISAWYVYKLGRKLMS